ncbi:Rhodanese-like domain-containing protein [Trichophaea hybrida]|nr:Rhodanese-like domain-containing protein [Trichophaea hybrida]
MALTKILKAPTSPSLLLSAALHPFTVMSSRRLSSFIVTPSELATALEKPNGSSRVVPVSAEWYLPNDPRKGYEQYLALRIPHARFFDLDAIKDEDSPYPHMLPNGEVFAKAMGELGIRREDTIVVYDSPHIGIFSAPRAAWTFKVFGHDKDVLNNFKLWKEQGLPSESGEIRAWDKTSYPVVKSDMSMVVGFERDEIIDARPDGRFCGTDPEPRPGLPSGHVPGSISISFSELIDPATKALKTKEELCHIFLEKGIDTSPKTDKILMCGTGVTAVVLHSALELAGVGGNKKVYDGSWTEWAQRVDESSGLIVKKPR